MRLKVIAEEKSAPWYAQGLRFTCTQCGNCCTGGPGYVWISGREIARLASHLKVSRKHIIDQYCRKIGTRYSLQEHRNSQGNYDCIFLKEEQVAARGDDGQTVVHTRRFCTVYSVRPLQCRTWPFWEGNLASRENWDRAANRCPGMNHGQLHPQERIESLRDAPDWPDGAAQPG